MQNLERQKYLLYMLTGKIIFLLCYYEVKTISLKYTALHILDWKNGVCLGRDWI